MNKQITLTDVIDQYIEENAIIGVGLITLAEDMSNYILSKSKKLSDQERAEWMMQ